MSPVLPKEGTKLARVIAKVCKDCLSQPRPRAGRAGGVAHAGHEESDAGGNNGVDDQQGDGHRMLQEGRGARGWDTRHLAETNG